MGLKISDESMTGDRTRHIAAYLANPAGPDDPQKPYWLVSWLPGRKLTRSQAVTAVMLAETTASGLQPGDRRWPHIDAWAAELGLTGSDAVVRTSEPLDPEDDWYASTADPDCDRVEDAEMADVQAREREAEA